jgi:hypothetical protein
METQRPRRIILCAAAALLLPPFTGLVAAPQTAALPEKPKIRTITAFVRLDRDKAQLAEQFGEAVKFLEHAKAVFEGAGYEVQTLRVTPQAFAVLTRGMSREAILSFYADYAAMVKKAGVVSAIGPPTLHAADELNSKTVELYAEVLAQHPELDGCLIVADDAGISWNSVRSAAHVMKYLADNTALSQGNFTFAAAARVEAGEPFYPASYHIGGGGQFAIGIQGASVVAASFAGAKGDFEAAHRALFTALGIQLTAIQDLAHQASGEWEFMGIDDSPAPLKDVSIGAAFESLLNAPFGSAGTLTVAALVTDVLKTEPAVSAIGYSGLMMPVLEDARLAQRWSEGRLTLDQLLQYSSVCGTGLDTIPLPGDVTEEQLARIIGDVATLAVKLKKPLTARLLPVKGKRAGDRTEFDNPNLVNVTLQPLR